MKKCLLQDAASTAICMLTCRGQKTASFSMTLELKKELKARITHQNVASVSMCPETIKLELLPCFCLLSGFGLVKLDLKTKSETGVVRNLFSFLTAPCCHFLDAFCSFHRCAPVALKQLDSQSLRCLIIRCKRMSSYLI